MKTTATILTLAVTALSSAGASFAGEVSGASRGRRPTIILRMIKDADVDERALLKAEKEAAAILDRSGIALVSLTCEAGRAVWTSGNPCQRERGAAEFWFHVVTRKPSRATTEMLGFTELDESTGSTSAGVFYSTAVELSDRYRCDVFQILGAAIAHEIGHLLLGANAHAPKGLMVPQWGPSQFEMISISELSFTSRQARLLREEVTRRTLAAGPKHSDHSSREDRL